MTRNTVVVKTLTMSQQIFGAVLLVRTVTPECPAPVLTEDNRMQTSKPDIMTVLVLIVLVGVVLTMGLSRLGASTLMNSAPESQASASSERTADTRAARYMNTSVVQENTLSVVQAESRF